MESRTGYLSLVLALGAFAISVTTAALVGLLVLAQQADLSTGVKGLQSKLDLIQTDLKDSQQRISELDRGLTALVQVADIDEEAFVAAFNQDNEAGSVSSADVTPNAVPEALLEIAQVELSGAVGSTGELPAPVDDNPFGDVAGLELGDSESPIQLVAVPSDPVSPEQVDTIMARRISENWRRPAGDVTGLKAVLKIELDREGVLKVVEVTRSSGNTEFDSSAKQAIEQIQSIAEVAMLSDEDYQKFYASRSLMFAPAGG